VDVRRSAREVYAHRGIRGPAEGNGAADGMWKATRSRRYPYAIKRDHPAVQALLDVVSEPALVEAVLVAIERSVPVPSSAAGEPATPTDVGEMVRAAHVLLRNLMSLGVERETAVERVARTEPFSQVPGIASQLRVDA
jgi:hypothetical protein